MSMQVEDLLDNGMFFAPVTEYTPNDDRVVILHYAIFKDGVESIIVTKARCLCLPLKNLIWYKVLDNGHNDAVIEDDLTEALWSEMLIIPD